jgi:hypothetical protein
VKQSVIATLGFRDVATLVGKDGEDPSPSHPRVREALARQGIDLTRAIIAWTDYERHIYCYRNRKEGDPD